MKHSRKKEHTNSNTDSVRAKKHLGQHFLRDENIAQKIVESLVHTDRYKKVLEVGPGMGVLTKYLLQQTPFETSVIDIDRESIAFLKQHFPELEGRIIEADFLHMDFRECFGLAPFAVIGNFPYNISSQILFKVLDHKNQVPEVVGMFQKEVAERIASPPGNKTYGILSVLLQAYYEIEYLFTVHENVFSPPPKVKSAVIRLTRNSVQSLDCDEVLFKKVVKAGFNQRRKTLRNALKQLITERNSDPSTIPFLDKRAEQLSVQNFVELTRQIQGAGE
jgi:16S rRNA (adenine1518-N6/adenine1519-N6)-dimethyltransferase